MREVTIHCQAEELILYKAYRDKGFAKEVDREKGQCRVARSFSITCSSTI